MTENFLYVSFNKTFIIYSARYVIISQVFYAILYFLT